MTYYFDNDLSDDAYDLYLKDKHKKKMFNKALRHPNTQDPDCPYDDEEEFVEETTSDDY